MNTRLKLGLSIALLALAAGLLWMRYRPIAAPRAGEPAEIIHPVTRERFKTTWDHVAAKGIRDLSPGGGWMMQYPGTNDLWGYVVSPGQSHPSETQPVTKQTGRIHGPVD